MERTNSIPLDENMEMLDLERVISHMEVDLSYHQSQTRLFEKKIMEAQTALENLRKQSDPRRHMRHFRHRRHHDDEGEDYEM